MTCCNSNTEHAFGWPPGPVRAILAITVTFVVSAVSIYGIVELFKSGNTEAALGIIATISGILGTIIGYYFGSKSAEKATALIAESEHILVENRNREIDLRNRELDVNIV